MLSSFRCHSSGLGGAVYIGSGPSRIVSCSADSKLQIRDADDPEKIVQDIQRLETTGLTSLAVNHQRQQFAYADKHSNIVVCDYPNGQPVYCVKTLLPTIVLAYNHTGDKLITGGDEEVIYVVSIRRPSEGDGPLKTAVLRKLKSVMHTRGLAYDPDGEFIAAISASGVLQIFSSMDGECLTKKPTGPHVLGNKMVKSGVAWHPNGLQLAVCGSANDVAVLNRGTWKENFCLSGEHEAPISLLAFSPNGLYLATAGQDLKLLIWDFKSRRKIAEQEIPADLASLDWQPGGNALLCMSIDGYITTWAKAVPPKYPGPCAEVEISASKEEVGSQAGPFDGISEENGENATAESEGRAAPSGGRFAAFDAIIQEGEHDDRAEASFEEASDRPRQRASGRSSVQRQPAFQPGEMPAPPEGKQRWLAYNSIGGVRMIEDGDMSVFDVVFFDKAANNAYVQPFRDGNYEVASLGEKEEENGEERRSCMQGVLYARKGRIEECPMLHYRPFEAAFRDSEWTVRLRLNDQIEAIAAGRNFVAAATSLHLLHVFSTAGLAIWLMHIDGPPVALAAADNTVAAVWHCASGVDDEQALEFAVFDINLQQRKSCGRLPLSCGSTLTWLGFSENGLLASFDSQGVLRVYVSKFGGCWTPIFSAEDAQIDLSEKALWPIALDSERITGILTDAGYGPARKIPVHELFDLRPPIGDMGHPDNEHERELLLVNLHIPTLQSQMDEGEWSDDDDEKLELEKLILAEQAKADRASLRLFNGALKAGKNLRAMELAAGMRLNRSIEACLKLANMRKNSLLAEKIHRILTLKEEEAAQAEEMESLVTPVPAQTFTTHFGKAEMHSLTPLLAQAAGTEASGTIDEVSNQAPGGSETKPNAGANGSSSSFVPSRAKAAAQQPKVLKQKNTGFSMDVLEGSKRKAPEANPFLRRSKISKQDT